MDGILDDPVYKAIYDNLSDAEKGIFDSLGTPEQKKAYLDTVKVRIDNQSRSNTNVPGVPGYPGAGATVTDTMTQDAIGGIGSRLISKDTGNPVLNSYKGYTSQQPVYSAGRGGMQRVEPRYFQGDESLVNNLSKEELTTLQQKMQKTGLLGKQYRLGVVDSTTVNAFSNLLAEANLMGVDFKTAISTLEASPRTGGGGGLAARVDNPDDLKRIIKKASQAVLGYSVGDDVVSRLVGAYQQEQIKAQTGGTGGVQMPSAESFAQARIEEQNPADAKAYKFAQFAQQFLES